MLGSIPLLMVVLDRDRRGDLLRRGRLPLGLLSGVVGISLLIRRSGEDAVDPVSALVLLAGAIAWCAGSLASRRAPHPASLPLTTAVQMVGGGLSLLVFSVAAGELPALLAATPSARALLCLGYLAFFGSVVTFSAYTWLIRVEPPARVATYAFVNPIVAVLLGAAVAGEPLTPRVGIAGAFVVAAVALVSTARAGGRPDPEGEPG